MMTDNAKKLHVLLSNFRGYVIKNQDKIKQDYLRFEKETSKIHKELTRGFGMFSSSEYEIKDKYKTILSIISEFNNGYVNIMKELYDVIKDSENVVFTVFNMSSENIAKFNKLAKIYLKLKDISMPEEKDYEYFKKTVSKIVNDKDMRNYFKNFVIKFSDRNIKKFTLEEVWENVKKDKNSLELFREANKMMGYIKTIYKFYRNLGDSPLPYSTIISRIFSKYKNDFIIEPNFIIEPKELLANGSYSKLTDMISKIYKEYVKIVTEEVFKLNPENIKNITVKKEELNKHVRRTLEYTQNYNRIIPVQFIEYIFRNIGSRSDMLSFTINLKPYLYSKLRGN
jgi:hypothetical protein